ncbi:MAG: hypothetical protein AAGE98_00210 [Actinomycetota bacterium]
MRRLVATTVAAVTLAACGADEPTTDALGSLDGYDVEIGERSCDEPADECVRVFRFRSATLDEVVDLVNQAGYPVDPLSPSAVLVGCKPDGTPTCAVVAEQGSVIRVAVSSRAG